MNQLRGISSLFEVQVDIPDVDTLGIIERKLKYDEHSEDFELIKEKSILLVRIKIPITHKELCNLENSTSVTKKVKDEAFGRIARSKLSTKVTAKMMGVFSDLDEGHSFKYKFIEQDIPQGRTPYKDN